MNKNEFLRQLEEGLAGVSPEERVSALQYYTEYLDEAGPEREAEVLAELGSPGQVAADVKNTSGEEAGGWTPPTTNPGKVPLVEPAPAEPPAAPAGPQLTLHPEGIPLPDAGTAAQASGNAETAEPKAGAPITNMPPPPSYPAPPPMPAQPRYPAPAPQNGGYQQQNASAQAVPRGDNGIRTVLIILALIFLSPLWLGLLGTLFGLMVTALTLLLVPFICGVAFVPAGIATFVAGILFLPVSTASGLLAMGLGLFLVGLGLLVLYAGGWLVRKGAPGVFRGVRSLFRKIGGLFRSGRE